jgi:hypothetical protein
MYFLTLAIFEARVFQPVASSVHRSSQSRQYNCLKHFYVIFIFKVRQMYNLITLIVYFHCPTCFEPLIWVHLQGNII